MSKFSVKWPMLTPGSRKTANTMNLAFHSQLIFFMYLFLRSSISNALQELFSAVVIASAVNF